MLANNRGSRYSSGDSGYSPFSNIYYPVIRPVSYQSGLIKPSWTHPEMLDLARVKAKRFVADFKFVSTKRKDRLKEQNEDEEEFENEDEYPRNYSIRRWGGGGTGRTWTPFVE
jgi:hypothetical protein